VAKSIRTFGAMPLIVTSGRLVISGNVWLEAAIMTGLTQLPVIVADHLTHEQAEAFMVAQVRLVEKGEWDPEKLGEILHDLTVSELDFDLDVIGFDGPEIDFYIEGLGDAPDADDPADAVVPLGPAVSQLGDLWLLGPHRLLCGDALALGSYERLMGRDVASVVVADPPYNVKIEGNVSGLGAAKHGEFAMASGEMSKDQFTAFLTQVMTLAAQHADDGALGYWFMDWRHLAEMTSAGEGAWTSLQNLCVWAKTNGGMGSLYRSQHELCFVFKKGAGPHTNNVQLGRFSRNRTNVWTYPGANTFGRGGEEGDLLAMHPTVKPVAMIADILLDATVRGDVVLDNFGGSGSTLIAAEKVGRKARLMELDPRYIDTAIRRWERWTGQTALLSADNLTFAEVGAQRAREAEHV
jgi:DNA modification methylase